MTTKTIVITGYGPGISHAVAEQFGAQGFSLVLAARNAEKLKSNAAALEAKGYPVLAVPTDAADPNSVKVLIAAARAKFGSIDVLHWNAASPLAGDLLTTSVEDLRSVFDAGVTGLVVAVQEALPDLRKAKNAAVLVTDGGYGLDLDAVDKVGVEYGAMGLSIGNAAKHKTVRLLNKKLKPENIYVAEVMVSGLVKGTAWDDGTAKLEASVVGARFWKLYTERTELSVVVG